MLLYNPLAYLFWMLFLLGLLPIVGMYGPFVLVLTKMDQQLAEAPYLFSSPQEKLKHDLGMYRVNNVRKYLNEGADINTVDGTCRTALSLAIRQGNYDLAEELINQGANLHLRDRDNRDALFYAVMPESRNTVLNAPKPNLRRAEIVSILLEKGANVAELDSQSSLQGAVETGSLELIKKLLQKGIKLNIQNRRSNHVYPSYACEGSPLVSAAEMGDIKALDFLLMKGADIHGEPSEKSCSPIIQAVEKRQSKAAIFLIDKGADVNSKDSEGNTLLMKVPRFRSGDELFSLLIQKGANVNAIGSYKQTALSVAAHQGDLEKVQMLLSAGANLNPKNQSAQQVLNDAVIGHNPNLVKFLLLKGIKPNIGHLVIALEKEQPEIVKHFLDAGINPNIPAALQCNHYNKRELAPLFEAIWKNNPKLVQLLLKYGADTHVQGALLEGPIEAAVMSPSSENTLTIIQLLLDHGADVNQLDYYGNTALDVISRRRVQEDKFADKIENLLRKNGGKLNR